MAKLNPTGEKKAPYFSKEAREARAAIQPIESSQLPTSVVQSQTIPQAVDHSTMKAILERIEAQDRKIKQLEGEKEHSEKGAKEVYKGPWNYAYTLWGGVPVISWKSFKKDPTKDLQVMNQFGQWESNHYLHVTLVTGQVVDIEVNQFNRDKTKTDPMPVAINTDITGKTVYVFNDTTYGKIELLSTYLN